MRATRALGLCLAAALPSLATAQVTVFGTHDGDLESYVSRPDIRPPKFTVHVQDDDAVADGYWLTAPYADLLSRQATRLHESQQIGPHIYDNHGDLVWSGAGMFPGRNVFDFRLTGDGPASLLSFLLTPNEHDTKFLSGAGVVMDTTYQVQKYVRMTKGAHMMNMHEFTLVDGGAHALLFMYEPRFFESSRPRYGKWTLDLGFVEIDVMSGETLFEWWALDHVHPLQSTVDVPSSSLDPGRAWDFFHINSIDKDADGDYLVSARHCNALYKVSGVDGSIVWQLGGQNSSFDQGDFTFSSQHDARFRGQDGNTTTLSFLNNASDGKSKTAETSSAMVMALDTSQMTATVLRKLDRPDGGLTELRGNVQMLPNGNVFVGWSENSYMTEFTESGRLVFSARFASNRFSAYRSYKFDFSATPTHPPDLVCTSYGASTSPATTVCHVSWNGATEVRSWNFYAERPDGAQTSLGSASKTGFETLFMAPGCSSSVFAEALDAQGRSLRNSSAITTTVSGNYECLPYAGNDTDTGTGTAPSHDSQAPHEPELSLHGLNVVFGRTGGGAPASWQQMTFCGVFGALGMLVAMQTPRAYRSVVRSRVRPQKHYIQV